MGASYVARDDFKTISLIAGKLYEQIRSLKTKKGRQMVDWYSVKHSIANMAANNLLVVFNTPTGKTVGVLAYTIEIPWYSNKPVLSEIFVLQIDPEFHGFGRVALKFLKETAKKWGCALLETSVSMTDDPKPVENLYKIKGKCDFSYKSFVWYIPNN